MDYDGRKGERAHEHAVEHPKLYVKCSTIRANERCKLNRLG